jgi:hypothetical protein
VNVKDKGESSQPDGMRAGKAEDDQRKSDMFSDRFTVVAGLQFGPGLGFVRQIIFSYGRLTD